MAREEDVEGEGCSTTDVDRPRAAGAEVFVGRGVGGDGRDSEAASSERRNDLRRRNASTWSSLNLELILRTSSFSPASSETDSPFCSKRGRGQLLVKGESIDRRTWAFTLPASTCLADSGLGLLKGSPHELS